MIHKSNLFKSKEIIRGDKELSFTGKPHYVLTLISPSVHDAFELKFKMPHEEYISDSEYSEFKPDVESMLADPSYQSHIIDMVGDSIDSFWKYKKLGGTWIETKEEALKNIDKHLSDAFSKIEIQVSVYYKVDVFGDSITTSSNAIGRISGDFIKTCEAFSSLIDSARPYIIRRMDDDMKPLIEDDQTKIENDLMMLNILLRKYPNHKELIPQ